jgi:hypothetical protein
VTYDGKTSPIKWPSKGHSTVTRLAGRTHSSSHCEPKRMSRVATRPRQSAFHAARITRKRRLPRLVTSLSISSTTTRQA